MRTLACFGVPPVAGFRHRPTFVGGAATDEVITRTFGKVLMLVTHRTQKKWQAERALPKPIPAWGNRLWIRWDGVEQIRSDWTG